MKHDKHVALLLAVCALLIVGVVPAAAQTGNNWRVEYFPNPDWAGSPVMVQDVPYVSYDWGWNAPGANMPADNWTLRAASTSFFYAGVYRLTLLADDEVLLLIDGVTYLDTRGQGRSGKTLTVDLPMQQGMHNLRIDFREWSQAAYLYLTVGMLSGSSALAPPAASPAPPPAFPGIPPLPASAASVKTRFGDYTPCIQQGLHQSQCFASDGQWNSPNAGSISMEPKIAVWGNCTSDSVTVFVVPGTPPTTKEYKCSKSEAGRFPN
jgi:hypothetical protein